MRAASRPFGGSYHGTVAMANLPNPIAMLSRHACRKPVTKTVRCCMTAHLYLRSWPSGVLSIDLERHQAELPICAYAACPNAKTHTALTDALILKWFDTHGPGSAWDIALYLGGEKAGYTEAWVVHRLCYIVDQLYAHDAPKGGAICSPPFIVKACEGTRPHTPEKNVGRANWSQASDEKLKLWVKSNGQKWRALARHMGGVAMGFSDDSVRNRHNRITGINVASGRSVRHTPVRGPPWSNEEDLAIKQLYSFRYRNIWKIIAGRLGNERTPAAVRLRAQRLGLVGVQAPTA